MIQSKKYYLDIFKVDVPLLETVIAEALRSGGSYADPGAAAAGAPDTA